MNIHVLLRVTLRRFGELMVKSFLCSSIITAAFDTLELFPSEKPVMLTFLCAGALVFFIINIVKLRYCYYDLKGQKEYYAANFIAYFLFMLAGLITISINNFAYTWVFGITKFLRFTESGPPKYLSAAIFHAVMLLAIVCAPVGMSWTKSLNRGRIQRDPDEYYEDILLSHEDLEKQKENGNLE